jgi:hypothetical protein
LERGLASYQKVGTTVHFEWTAGKKSPILKTIDRAAKAAAKRGGQDIDRGFRPGIIARSLVKGTATRFPANGQQAVIRPYKKTLLGKSENKVRFDVFSEDSSTYMVADMVGHAMNANSAIMHEFTYVTSPEELEAGELKKMSLWYEASNAAPIAAMILEEAERAISGNI